MRYIDVGFPRRTQKGRIEALVTGGYSLDWHPKSYRALRDNIMELLGSLILGTAYILRG